MPISLAQLKMGDDKTKEPAFFSDTTRHCPIIQPENEPNLEE